MAEIALFYKLQNLNLFEALDKIYEEFGFSHESLLSLDYFGIEGTDKISRIMKTFRQYNDSVMLDNKIAEKKDYLSPTTGLPSSDVLGFFFESGDQLFLRPSGTEPKIKFYIMIQERVGTLAEKKSKALLKTEKFLAYIRTLAEKA
jgi:phosphoglucomutase